MQTKSNPDEIESFLTDASFIRDGHADRVVIPESIDEVSEILANANRNITPVTILVTGLSINHVLSNSFGFGGNTSSLIFSKVVS